MHYNSGSWLGDPRQCVIRSASMLTNKDNHCRLCGKLFCCVNCRKKHALNEHKDTYSADCPLCNNSELILRPNSHAEFIEHVAKIHLPLICLKCNQYVEKAEDLLKLDPSCVLIKVAQPAASAAAVVKVPQKSPAKIMQTINRPKAAEVATQTHTPLSKFNMAWSQKNSISLVRNASTDFMGQNSKITTRLTRSTSTPTQDLMCVLQASHFMNGSVNQLSSICNQTADMPTNNSPFGVPAAGYTPMAPKVDNRFKLPLHFKARGSRGAMNATPLRHVMEQSVQRATLQQRDFRMCLAVDMHQQQQQLYCPSPGSQPLDLRKSVTPPKEEVPIREEEPALHSSTNILRTPTKVQTVPNGGDDSPGSDSEQYIFYTPQPVARSIRRRSSIFTCVEMEEELRFSCTEEITESHHHHGHLTRESSYDDEVEQPAKENEAPNKMSLWNVLSSVFKFASMNLLPQLEYPSESGEDREEASVNLSVKRRLASPNVDSPKNRIKRTRIQGRPPIARMRDKP